MLDQLFDMSKMREVKGSNGARRFEGDDGTRITLWDDGEGNYGVNYSRQVLSGERVSLSCSFHASDLHKAKQNFEWVLNQANRLE